MLGKSSLLLAILLWLSTICQASPLASRTSIKCTSIDTIGSPLDPACLSNAQRLARGLTPAAPKKLYKRSRTGAPLAKRSVDPTARVNVYARNIQDEIVGYMLMRSASGLAGLVPDAAQADKFYPTWEGNALSVGLQSIAFPTLDHIVMSSAEPYFIAAAKAIEDPRFNTPSGYPGALIPAPQGTPSKVYWQQSGAFANTLWIATSAANVNTYLRTTAVSENDLVTLYFGS